MRRWFGNGKRYGAAVVLGKVSADLTCRDFDDMASYERWVHDRPDLAATLPTVATSRGRHVYFRAAVDTEKLGDGELRGNGGYCLLPPSTHESGHRYRWEIPLPAGALPKIDPFAVGLAHLTQEQHKNTQEHSSNWRRVKGGSKGRLLAAEQLSPSAPDVERAILDSLPIGPGQRHRQVFELARALKAIPSLADAPAAALKLIVQRWHELALPVINTKYLDDTWIDFCKAWPRVKFAKGCAVMSKALAKAMAADLPEAALSFDRPQVRELVALCRLLQRSAGDRPFFLACRTAGSLWGVTHVTAWNWLSLLVAEGVLEVVTTGSKATKQASEYRYLPRD
jgi:hypothetical protein